VRLIPSAPKTPCFGYRKRKTCSHCCQRHKCKTKVLIALTRKVSTSQGIGGCCKEFPATPEARMTGPTWAIKPMSSAVLASSRAKAVQVFAQHRPYFLAHLPSFLAHLACSFLDPHFLPQAFTAGAAISADEASAMANRALRCFTDHLLSLLNESTS